MNRIDGIAKVLGLVASVTGALFITLYKGPAIYGLNSHLRPAFIPGELDLGLYLCHRSLFLLVWPGCVTKTRLKQISGSALCRLIYLLLRCPSISGNSSSL